MNFPKLDCPWIIAFLSITIATRDALSAVPTLDHGDPPFWQFVLREFVFKTVSPPSSTNDVLYKEILGAPFYGGSSLDTDNNENALISRGDVYHTIDGQWILCQEGCVNCQSCEQQNNPTVKWILRKVRRLSGGSSNSPKWDLRLSVFPQLDEISRSNEDTWSDDVYVNSQDELGIEEPLHNSNLTSTQPDSAKGEEWLSSMETEETDWPSEDIYSNEESSIKEATYRDDFRVSRKRSIDPSRVKRYRPETVERPGSLSLYYPRRDSTRAVVHAESRSKDVVPRLIMGIDQHGEKHLVHVVPVDSPSDQLETTNYRNSHQSGNMARISRTIQQERDAFSYQKLMDRIMDSLNSHRSFIEKFLFSDRLEPENRNPGVKSSRFAYPKQPIGDDIFTKRTFDDHRLEISPRVNQYSADSGYRVHERDDQFKRHGDVTRVVNKPSDEHQDHTIPYETQVTTADDREYERSPASTDIERRRRNLFAKVLTEEHQGYGQNISGIDQPDEKFSMKMQLVENSTDQALMDSGMKMNVTNDFDR